MSDDILIAQTLAILVLLFVKAKALSAGLNAAQYSGHSGRAGLATSVVKAGVIYAQTERYIAGKWRG